MVHVDGVELDIRAQNVAVERTLEQTTNPRHRYLLEVYLRHRYLESAGRWQEILSPELTVDDPTYRFHLVGRPPMVLHGRDQVAALYRHWTDTDQNVFYVSDETVAVGDNLVVGRGIGYQQTLGAELGGAAKPDAMYLVRSQITMVWPYDDDGRLLGEDVHEWDTDRRAVFELDPADVLTAAQAGELLAPYIRPVPALVSA